MSTTPRLSSAIPGREPDFGGLLWHQPELATEFGRMYGQFWSDGVLDHPTKEAVRLRNDRITDCGY